MEGCQPAPGDEVASFPWIEPDATTPPQYSILMPHHCWLGHDMSAPMVSMSPPTTPIARLNMSTEQPSLPEIRLPLVSIPAFISPLLPSLPNFPVGKKRAPGRRMLTNQAKKKICLYHEKNKTATQTEIGVLFGVERSTVSKILSQKAGYLKLDDGNQDATKNNELPILEMPNHEAPDFGKAVSNWARKCQDHGVPISDHIIANQARYFAVSCGYLDAAKEFMTQEWLDGFKSKHSVGEFSRYKHIGEENKGDTFNPTDLWSMGGPIVQCLSESPHMPLHIGLAHYLTQVDGGNFMTSHVPQGGNANDVRRALELVEDYFAFQQPGLHTKTVNLLKK